MKKVIMAVPGTDTPTAMARDVAQSLVTTGTLDGQNGADALVTLG